MLNRRQFCALSTLSVAGLHRGSAQSTRLNLAEIDHDRILAAAARALERKVQPGDANSQAHLDFTLDLPALAAANYIAADPKYPAQALLHLRPWLLEAKTRLPTTAPDPESILLTAPMAEVAVALPFLGLPEADLMALKSWFSESLAWLTDARTALLARDAKDHNGSSWLLQVAAYARLTGNDAVLTSARHQFKTSTIRAQIDANGMFPRELTTPNPFRNSLMNLDLLAGCCVLLSTIFDSVWEHELQDGPGMRAVIARHAPYIERPNTWPYPSDQTRFHELPCRRPALLFAARAYYHADYAELWKKLNPDPGSAEILRAFPIRQPILWQSQPRAVPI
jgi:hypothetical protein